MNIAGLVHIFLPLPTLGNIVAIVGRPNVGKSTLFNRLTDSRQAITDETAGVTRDRNYGKAEWNGREFSVIDTGGYALGSEDIFEAEIRKQVELAVDEASLILFVVDGIEGLHDTDITIARILNKSGKKVVLVVNKIDNFKQISDANEFYSLGLGDFFCIASASGSGTGDLLDEVVRQLPEVTEENLDEIPKFAIVGRPNVGKSSLTNSLIGEERSIVTSIAGTTRDSIHTRYQKFGFDFILIDTAGIRKKAKVHEDLEFFSVMRSIRAIEESDVCLLMIDATEGMEAQDLNIFSLAEKNNRGVMILVNKWDLVEKNHKSTKEFEDRIRERIAPFRDVPILFISALTKQRIHKALEIAVQVFENRKRKIPTHKLNEFILPIIENQPPPATKGKYVKIKFVSQLPMHYPAFAFFCNLPQYVAEPYKRFLENRLRQEYDFSGVPISIFMRKK